jgi:DNA-binding LacI/PurR family transcriptional regulator
VAQSLGVSITTVSNAFNRPDQLSDKLRQHILTRAEEIGYRGPGAEGRLLRTGYAGAIALYIPEPLTYLLEDAFAAEFLSALVDACQQRQIGLLLLPAVPHADSNNPRPPAALDVAAVDAVIFYGLAADDPVITRAIDRGKPVIGIDMIDRDEMMSVGVDDIEGAYQAARHLLANGHTKIAVLALPTSRQRSNRPATAVDFKEATIRFPQDRWNGYARAFADAELDTENVSIDIVAVNSVGNGRAAMEKLLAAPENMRPTAVLAMSDVLAHGAMQACAAQGFNVPIDIAIIGFDDAPFAAGIGLSTVSQNPSDKAEMAVQCALGEDIHTKRLPARLIIRQTA